MTFMVLILCAWAWPKPKYHYKNSSSTLRVKVQAKSRMPKITFSLKPTSFYVRCVTRICVSFQFKYLFFQINCVRYMYSGHWTLDSVRFFITDFLLCLFINSICGESYELNFVFFVFFFWHWRERWEWNHFASNNYE